VKVLSKVFNWNCKECNSASVAKQAVLCFRPSPGSSETKVLRRLIGEIVLQINHIVLGFSLRGPENHRSVTFLRDDLDH